MYEQPELPDWIVQLQNDAESYKDALKASNELLIGIRLVLIVSAHSFSQTGIENINRRIEMNNQLLIEAKK